MLKRRLPIALLAAIVLAALSGFFTGALAAKAESPWKQFASWGSGSAKRCAAQKAIIVTDAPPVSYEPAGYGQVRYRSGSSCDPKQAPVGYLGVTLFVSRGDGAICASTGWRYNTSKTAKFEAGVLAGCPKANSRRTGVTGRVYRTSSGAYTTADFVTLSPYQN